MVNVGLIRCKIDYLNHCFGRYHMTDGVFLIGTKRCAPAKFSVSGRRIVRRNEVQRLAVPAIDISEVGFAEAYCFRQHGGKYGLKIARRAADDL